MPEGIHLSVMMGPLNFEPIPKELLESLLSVQVTSSAGARNGFQLSFAFSQDSLINRELLPGGYFDPPRRVVIVVTLNGTPDVIMDGVITRHELSASNDPGASTLTVTGLDVSQMMDLIDWSDLIKYPAMPPSVRALTMIAKYAAYGLVPLVVPSIVVGISNPLEQIPSHQGTDWAYINKLADEVGYVFYVDPGPVPGTNTAYWGPEIKTGPPQPALTVNMDAYSNVESLSFSFDGLAKKLFYILIHNKESKVSVPVPIPDISPLNPPLGLKPPLPLGGVVQMNRFETAGGDDSTSKYDIATAAGRGLARASGASNVISASGALDVVRYGRVLKARQLVGVRGAGTVYDGLYFVKSVTHNIQAGEYKQNFSLTRNAHVPFGKTVAV